MNDDLAAKMFPSMAPADTASAPAPTTPADGQADMLAKAFPSMVSERPAAPAQETSTPPTPNTQEITSAASRVSAPSASEPTAPTDTGEPTTLRLEDVGEIALPQGLAVDTAALEEFTSIAAEHRFDGATAQRMIDLHAAALSRTVDAAERQILNDWSKVQAGWHEEVVNDPEVGGDNLVASASVAQRVLRTYAPELKADLETMGLSDHPRIFKLLVKVGRALGFSSSFDSTRNDASSAGRSDDEVARAAFPSMK